MSVVNQWRADITAGTLTGPRLVASSPIVDGPKPLWRGSIPVADAEEGRAAVRYIKRRGNDFIKVYELLPRDAYFAIADEAKKQGLVFAGHVPHSVNAGEASNTGQKSIEHLTGILVACSTEEGELRREILNADEGNAKIPRSEFIDRMLASYSASRAAALFAHFVRNGTWMCPTLTVLRSFAYLDDHVFTADGRLKYLPAAIREEWKPANDFRFKKLTSEDFGMNKKRYQKQLEIVGAMHRAGVRMLAGTDAWNPYCFPGFSLHDELAMLVEAGLTPFEALQTATRNPAEYLGKLDSLGTVEKGKLADLVLLDANPLDNIDNTRRMRAVVANGRYFPRVVVDRMLAEVERVANKK